MPCNNVLRVEHVPGSHAFTTRVSRIGSHCSRSSPQRSCYCVRLDGGRQEWPALQPQNAPPTVVHLAASLTRFAGWIPEQRQRPTVRSGPPKLGLCGLRSLRQRVGLEFLVRLTSGGAGRHSERCLPDSFPNGFLLGPPLKIIQIPNRNEPTALRPAR